ncbi:MAG: tetratricopeptide repeat protein [Desulfobacteraceae bacterium]|nr:tetratricopeptide repeat protein [Desulfobacteraceae bacterium]
MSDPGESHIREVEAPADFRTAIGCIGLFFLILLAFLPVLDNGFVHYDDDLYITQNERVQAGLSWEGLLWSLTTTHAANWHPLTWLSHMADVELFGLDPAGHHWTSLVLHIINVFLLFFVLREMTGDSLPSLAVAALFAVHPLHVESVAWISERKELLSALFGLLSLLFYARYVHRGGRLRYAAALTAFALSLTAKPMLVTLPFVLLLLDWWPLGRVAGGAVPADTGRSVDGRSWGFLLVEKAPWLTLSAASSFMTLWAQHSGGAIAPTNLFPPLTRLANAVYSYGLYMIKTIWPSPLAFFYPHPGRPPLVQVLVIGVALAALTGLAYRLRLDRPYLTIGWLWFLGMLVPVIGLVQVGVQAMADRYTYMPLTGLFIAIVWILRDWAGEERIRRRLVFAFLAAAILAMVPLTRSQVRTWKNDFTLNRHAIEVVDGNYVAHHNLAVLLFSRGYLDAAIGHYRKALAFHPRDAKSHNHLAVALAQKGAFKAAELHFQEAIHIDKNYVGAYINLGVLMSEMGRRKEAIKWFRKAVQIDPSNRKASAYLQSELKGLQNDRNPSQSGK